jgi:hypothetical protein
MPSFTRILTLPMVVKATTDSDGARVLEGFASSPLEDRQGEVVSQKSLLRSFERTGPIPYFRDHDSRRAIGYVEAASIKDGKLYTRAKIVPPGKMADADDLWALLEIGTPVSQSVGFNPLGTWDDSGDDVDGVWHWGGKDGAKDFEWLELSSVMIGANREADLHMAKGLGLDLTLPTPPAQPPATTDPHELTDPLPVVVRDVVPCPTEWVCPHCDKVIHEKHLAATQRGDDLDWQHRDCGGRVLLPASQSATPPAPAPRHKSWGDLSAEDINRQIDAQLNSPGKIRYWVVELFETYCILSDDNDGKHYRVSFALVDGNVVLGERVEVTQEWVEVRLSYDGVLTQEEREELRFSDDLTAAGKRLEAARNICRHWVKGGRALSPESLDAVLSPMSMIPEILRAGRVLSDKNRTAVLAALEALTEVVQRDDESRASSNKPAAEDTVDDDTTKGITQERDSAPDTAASILDAPWKTERRQRSLLDLPA